MVELNKRVENLEERLVEQVDAREEMSAGDTRCPDNDYEHIEVIDLLVKTLKERTAKRAELSEQKAARDSSREETGV